MKRKYLLLCLGIALASLCQSQTPPDFMQKVAELTNEAANKGLFSGSVGIGKDGKLVYTKQYGYADWDAKRPFNANTLFDIGSFNKDYTREMINQLVKEGKVTLGDPLSKHLVLFGNETDNKITIEMLLEMRSGLGDYLQAPGFSAKEKEGNLSLQDRISAIKTQPLLFEPGKGKAYSNSGYAVLGAVIEKVTGKQYDQNLKERILQPLGLTHTFYTKQDILQQPQRAVGTTMNFRGDKKAVDDVWSDASPDGGIYASMSDLLRFITAFYNGNLPSGINYPQRPLAGGSNYWNTVVVPFADGTMVLIMSNLGEIADALARRIYAIGNGQTPEPLKKTNEMQLYDEWKTNGINYVEANIQNIVKQFDLPYDSRFLNYFGYRFLKGGDTEAALQFFQLNTKLFPKEANTYDSLAEAWLAKGDKGKAIQYYNKALEVDPQFKNAKKMLAQLSEK